MLGAVGHGGQFGQHEEVQRELRLLEIHLACQRETEHAGVEVQRRLRVPDPQHGVVEHEAGGGGVADRRDTGYGGKIVAGLGGHVENSWWGQRIALAVVYGSDRPVDRQLMKIRPTESADLRIGVGKQPALQQRIVGEIDPRHDMPRAERDLLDLCKEVIRVAVQYHFAQGRDGNEFFGDDLGGVEEIEVELMLVFLGDNLYAKFPFRVVPHLDRFRSEEHTSELQSLMRISYAVFCLKQKNNKQTTTKSNMTMITHHNSKST